VLDGGAASESRAIRAGDELVAVGPFDVSELGLEGVLDLLSRWSAPTVRLCLRSTKERAGDALEAGASPTPSPSAT
jgi:hypothetical protein